MVIVVYFQDLVGTVLSTKINESPIMEEKQETILWQNKPFLITATTSRKYRRFKINDSTFYTIVMCVVYENKYQRTPPITNLNDILSNVLCSLAQPDEEILIFNKDKFNGTVCNMYTKQLSESLSVLLNVTYID